VGHYLGYNESGSDFWRAIIGCTRMTETTERGTRMTNSSAARLSSEFDNFLFAPIGDDANGMLLTVLSALARSDLDPWNEAARLAGLPEKYATARLTALIEGLHDRPAVSTGYRTIAARLVTLLPRRTISDAPLPRTQRIFGVAPNAWAVVCVVLMVLALGAEWVTVSNQAPATNQAHATADSTAAQAAVAAPPAVPAPSTGERLSGGTL
jgi:hypothetical protein